MVGLPKYTADYLYTKQRRSETKAQLIAKLGGKCVWCGATDRLHFDHIDPSTKLFDISQNLTTTKAKLFLEVEKCQLLCGSCHGKKTANDNPNRTYHGKLSMYTNRGCRCPSCRKANAEYMSKFKKAKKAQK